MDTVPEHDDSVSEMVKSGAGIVREVPEEQTPLGRHGLQEPDFEQILLGRTRLILAKDRIRVAHEPGINLPIQRFRIRLCPAQLEPKAVERVVRGRDEPRASHGGNDD